MKENGLIERWIETFSPKNLCANEGKMKGGQVASLRDVYGALIFLGLGLLLGIIVFTIEIYLKRRTTCLTFDKM